MTELAVLVAALLLEEGADTVFLPVLRDLAIIFLALESIVTLTLLTILIWQLWRLIKMLQTEVLPVIRDAQDTVSTVRGTTTFMSDNVVTPVVSAGSKVAGARRTMQVLMADLPLQRTSKTKAPPFVPPSPVPDITPDIAPTVPPPPGSAPPAS
jgi:hypothetical protein